MLLNQALFFDRFMVSFVNVLPEFYGSYFGVLGEGFHILLGALHPGLICSNLSKLAYRSHHES